MSQPSEPRPPRFCPECGASGLNSRLVLMKHIYECFCACGYICTIFANDYFEVGEPRIHGGEGASGQTEVVAPKGTDAQAK